VLRFFYLYLLFFSDKVVINHLVHMRSCLFNDGKWHHVGVHSIGRGVYRPLLISLLTKAMSSNMILIAKRGVS